jgi:hypothetical protein
VLEVDVIGARLEVRQKRGNVAGRRKLERDEFGLNRKGIPESALF